MYVLGFPAVKSVNAHSFQKIGTQKSCGQFGEWDPATYSVEDSLFGTIEFHNGGILWAGNVICTQHPRTVDYERQLLW
ncbi:oxidoreductase, NADH-binding [Escherichia coli]|uniref:Oxidoreductase, NADH-binding n=1 Tax=Escherichia coli TaxID=562 RepID=A0A2X3K6V9_ECOLX|nr:oxidoreductase, NADH-binding [Escherichia coli]